MTTAIIALNDHFHYSSKIARTLQQFLPSTGDFPERKMIQLWFDELEHMDKTIDQMVIRSDYMWFILMMLQSRRIRV
ncbi:hypothetical protein HUJ04_011793 [Dendroctonus ponderosae]|nr:hypothetical protein HUJ04_011793 [Dendroctonus ponderosae]